jgi:RNA polymerase sigma-70 factor, ECF subfamily
VEGSALPPPAGELRVPRARRDGEDRRREFDALVAQYEKKIYNLILRQIGDRDEAADLTQETFISAYRGFASFRGECKISTWLCQIALNHCKNRFQQRDRQQQRELFSLDAPMAPDAPPFEIPDWTHSPQRLLEAEELQRRIQEATRCRLPPGPEAYPLPADTNWRSSFPGS